MDFEDVLQQYRSLIYHIIRKLNIRVNVDEYYHIGTIALWEATRRYDAKKGSFFSFAFKMVYWQLASEVRKNMKRQNMYVPLTDELACTLKYDVDFFERLTYEELSTPLSPRERTWFVRHVIEGKTFKQIAAEERVSVHAVKQWREQAVKKLRRHVSCADVPYTRKRRRRRAGRCRENV